MQSKSVSKNKAKCIELLLKQLANDGHDIRNNEDDADTLIVSIATEYTKKQHHEVVVIANDTDILVLLMYHCLKSMKMHSVTKKNSCKKQTWKIEDIVLAIGNQIERHISFVNTWTACDTTSATYKQGTLYFNSTIQFIHHDYVQITFYN